ncbi:MAG: hypothetical protein C5B50_17745 [Verrucomicrobia bacterium]|nr:MAG: hypothetical protein C5B50_17745 [Verrucomicrobiota bacterium]
MAKSGRDDPRVIVYLLLTSCLLCGCAASRPRDLANHRAFDFQKDTFAFANELCWKYGYDENGQWMTEPQQPKPEYTLHCLVLARSAKQFFEHARFEPKDPPVDEQTYRKLIRQVVSTNPRREPPESENNVVIPGYADLHSFSLEHEKQLKAECGSAWQSYLQRGNWRMVFPFTHHEQQHMAEQLVTHLQAGFPLVVHVVSFPNLTINHTVLVFAATETARQIEFKTYDPNLPTKPQTLLFDRAERSFSLHANDYFPGGKVKAYELYWKWDY